MKINEFASDRQHLEEANPYGLGSRLKSAVMGKLGSKKAQASGDVGKRANELYASFNDWALRSGVNMQAVPKKQLVSWLTSQGLPGKLPAAYATMPTINLEDPATSTAVWTGLAQGAYGAAPIVAPGTATLGANYGLSPPAPRAPVPAPRRAAAPAPAPAPAPIDVHTVIDYFKTLNKRSPEYAILVKAFAGIT